MRRSQRDEWRVRTGGDRGLGPGERSTPASPFAPRATSSSDETWSLGAESERETASDDVPHATGQASDVPTFAEIPLACGFAFAPCHANQAHVPTRRRREWPRAFLAAIW